MDEKIVTAISDDELNQVVGGKKDPNKKKYTCQACGKIFFKDRKYVCKGEIACNDCGGKWSKKK